MAEGFDDSCIKSIATLRLRLGHHREMVIIRNALEKSS
jgi:hypothetical protein